MEEWKKLYRERVYGQQKAKRIDKKGWQNANGCDGVDNNNKYRYTGPYTSCERYGEKCVSRSI